MTEMQLSLNILDTNQKDTFTLRILTHIFYHTAFSVFIHVLLHCCSSCIAQVPLGSSRHVRRCRAHAFWLWQACQTARLDMLDKMNWTGSTWSSWRARLAQHVEHVEPMHRACRTARLDTLVSTRLTRQMCCVVSRSDEPSRIWAYVCNQPSTTNSMMMTMMTKKNRWGANRICSVPVKAAGFATVKYWLHFVAGLQLVGRDRPYIGDMQTAPSSSSCRRASSRVPFPWSHGSSRSR